MRSCSTSTTPAPEPPPPHLAHAAHRAPVSGSLRAVIGRRGRLVGSSGPTRSSGDRRGRRSRRLLITGALLLVAGLLVLSLALAQPIVSDAAPPPAVADRTQEWVAITGLITAVAGLLTAIAGLITAVTNLRRPREEEAERGRR